VGTNPVGMNSAFQTKGTFLFLPNIRLMIDSFTPVSGSVAKRSVYDCFIGVK
jgi:hypothetical protein